MGRDKLNVELKAQELIADVARLLKKVRNPDNACKHLDKSADSLYFNLGEGTAAFSPRKKASKYDIARGEAKEVQKALTALVLKGKLSQADIALAYDLADCIIGMLTNMIKPRGPLLTRRPTSASHARAALNPNGSRGPRPRPRPRPNSSTPHTVLVSF